MKMRSVVKTAFITAVMPLILHMSLSFILSHLEINTHVGSSLQLGFVILLWISVLGIHRFAFAPYSFFKDLNIPYVKPEPVLGNTRELLGLGNNEFHLKYMEKYGNVFGTFVGRRPRLSVADPDMLKQIFVKDFHIFNERSAAFRQRPPMDSGMLFAKYNVWKKVRTTCSPTFTAGKIKHTMPLIEECLDNLLLNFENASRKHESTEIWSVYGKFTLDVILSVAFGKRWDVQDSADIFKEMNRFFRFTLFGVTLDLVDPPRWLRDFLSSHIVANDPSYIVNLLRPIVEERRKSKEALRQDFLDLILAETSSGTTKLSDDEIIAQAFTFLLAGYDTTGNALSYTTYLLALNPDVQEKLYQEVSTEVHTNEDESVYEKLQKLTYLDQVFSESLRLYPPAYVTVRDCTEDHIINGIRIPKGLEVAIPIFSIHHSPKFWENPEKFDPERFNSAAKANRHPCIYLPFGHGPRGCIGMRFALMEAKLALAAVVRKFKFEKCVDTEVPLQLDQNLTMSPKNGIRLRVIARE